MKRYPRALNCTVSEAQDDAITATAKLYKSTRAAVIRDAIARYIERYGPVAPAEPPHV